MKTQSAVGYAILGFIIGFMVANLLSNACDRQHTDGTVHTDTRIIRDTVTDRSPVIAVAEENELAYIKVPALPELPDITFISDTVHIKDTVYVPVRWVQNKYETPDYQAWVSGYEINGKRPQLDSVMVFPETRYITKEMTSAPKPKRWGVGLQAGLGVSLPAGKPQLTPYIGIGISYNFVRF